MDSLLNKENEVPHQRSEVECALPVGSLTAPQTRSHEDALRQLEQVLLQRKLVPTTTQVGVPKATPVLRRRQRTGCDAPDRYASNSPISRRFAQRAPRDPLRETQRDQIAAAWRQRISREQGNGIAKTPSVCKALFSVQDSAPAQPASVTFQQNPASRTPTPRSSGSSCYHHRVTADFNASKVSGQDKHRGANHQFVPSGRVGNEHDPQGTVLTDTSLIELENQIANLLEAKCGAEEELAKLRLQCQRTHNENRQLRLQLARLEGALETKNEHWQTARAELEESQKQLALARQEHDRIQTALQETRLENQRVLQARDALQMELKQVQQAAEAEVAQKEQLYEKELCKLHTACARQERVIDDLQRQWLRLNAMLQDLFVNEAPASETEAPWLSPPREMRTPRRA